MFQLRDSAERLYGKRPELPNNPHIAEMAAFRNSRPALFEEGESVV
jgi:hypothetical protein